MSNSKNNGNKFSNWARLTVRIGTAPEAKHSAAGALWTRCRVALSMGKNDDGEYKPSMWFTAKAFTTKEGDASLPETLSALKKGDFVTLSGRLAYAEYEQDGEKRSDAQILVSQIEPCDAKAAAGAGEDAVGEELLPA